jgi:hypothetical protein
MLRPCGRLSLSFGVSGGELAIAFVRPRLENRAQKKSATGRSGLRLWVRRGRDHAVPTVTVAAATFTYSGVQSMKRFIAALSASSVAFALMFVTAAPASGLQTLRNEIARFKPVLAKFSAALGKDKKCHLFFDGALDGCRKVHQGIFDAREAMEALLKGLAAEKAAQAAKGGAPGKKKGDKKGKQKPGRIESFKDGGDSSRVQTFEDDPPSKKGKDRAKERKKGKKAQN